MDYRFEGDELIVRIDPGEEVIAALEKLMQEADIEAGFFEAIGAVDSITLGHYDTESEEYREKDFEGQFEVVSFEGNMTPEKVHAHAAVADRDFELIGGHCSRAVVSGTFEVHVEETDHIEHKRDDSTGLDVLDL